MIKPSDIDTDRRFFDSKFRNSERETIARNVVILSQVVAFASDDDRWLPFSLESYEQLRAETSNDPVGFKERSMLANLLDEGYLAKLEDDKLTVTAPFIEVVAQFATVTALNSAIASPQPVQL